MQGTENSSLFEGGFSPEASEITMAPVTLVDLDLSASEKVIRLIDVLENLDDVQNVYSNAEVSAWIIDKLQISFPI